MTGVKVVVLLGCLSILASMAMLLVIFGQRQAEVKQSEQEVLLKRKVQKITSTAQDRDFMLQLLKQQHDAQKKATEELETEVNNLGPEVEKKKAEAEVCQGEKKKKDEELSPIQKEQTDLEATFNAEKEGWTAEIAKLKEQIVQPSKVCEFVKKDSADAKTLCAVKTETA